MAITDVPDGHRRRSMRATVPAPRFPVTDRRSWYRNRMGGRGGRHLLTSLLAVAAVVMATVTATTAGAQIDAPPSGTAPAGSTPSQPAPAQAAASWLADQFVDGERFETSFEGQAFPDHGLTVDAVLALSAAGVADSTAAAATDWLEQSATTASYIGTPDTFAGSVAKLALLAQVRGLDPTSWGEDGLDLIAQLQGREGPGGRFTDDSEQGDFSNSITQSMAVITLHRQAGTAASDASLDMLLMSQCDDGGFALELEPEPGACASGVDTTSYALQALLTADRDGDDEETAAAVEYLLAAQQEGGGFGTDAASAPNANSTGLGVQGLRVAGQQSAADAGAAFIATLQLGCDAPAERQGAIDFDGGEFDPSNAARATAQGILGLAGTGFAALSADGASDARPRPACDAPPPGDGGTTPPTAPDAGGGGTGVATPSPRAVPVRAQPSYTG